MSAAASISSGFITDAIADFKGRLDTLMEESLTKYREKTVADMGDDYAEGYGEITKLAEGKYTQIYDGGRSFMNHSLPTKVPTGKFDKRKGIWLIHSCSFKQMGLVDRGGSRPDMGDIAVSGFAFDNYGNYYTYIPYTPHTPTYCTPEGWSVPSVEIERCSCPLPKSLIDVIKRIPVDLGSTANPVLHNNFPLIVSIIVKLAAETAYKSRQATLHLQQQLAAEKVKTAALEAELRAIKSTSSPSVDLLGLNVAELAPTTSLSPNLAKIATQPTLNVMELG
jgi:hypothetical protein